MQRVRPTDREDGPLSAGETPDPCTVGGQLVAQCASSARTGCGRCSRATNRLPSSGRFASRVSPVWPGCGPRPQHSGVRAGHAACQVTTTTSNRASGCDRSATPSNRNEQPLTCAIAADCYQIQYKWRRLEGGPQAWLPRRLPRVRRSGSGNESRNDLVLHQPVSGVEHLRHDGADPDKCDVFNGRIISRDPIATSYGLPPAPLE
jgi:hypothetical protein